MTKTKNGLVLGGGGSRGSYTMGVLSELIDQKMTFDIVTGISIGALVGAVYTQQKYGNLKAWIDHFTPQSVVTNTMKFPNAHLDKSFSPDQFNEFITEYQKDGPSVAPLKKTFLEIFDWESFKNSPIDYACIAANLTKNEKAVFYKKDMTKDDVVDCICASAAYFPAFSFVELNGNIYADGGYLDTTLGDTALEMGANDLYVVALKNPGEKVLYDKEHTKMLFRPILKLKYFLDFETDDLLTQIAQGRLEAKKFLNLAPGYIYTFYAEDYMVLDGLSDVAKKEVSKMGYDLTNEELVDGITTLLGYRPLPLENDYMSKFQAGLILECLALITGISPYEQYHLLPFIKEILKRLQDPTVPLSKAACANLYAQMESEGIRDLLTFFHTAMNCFGGKLPEEFDWMIKKFAPLYYLAIAWRILDLFAPLVNLF